MATTTIKFDRVITIDDALKVNLHALSSGNVVIRFDQSLPSLAFSAHMSSAEARVLGSALVEYADMADGQQVAPGVRQVSATFIDPEVAELVDAIKDLRDLYESTPADDNSRRFWAASESAWSRVDTALANVGAQP